MFHKKLMKVFKKIELYEKNEITFFLYLLMQDFKNCVKFFYFFYIKKTYHFHSFFII